MSERLNSNLDWRFRMGFFSDMGLTRPSLTKRWKVVLLIFKLLAASSAVTISDIIFSYWNSNIKGFTNQELVV